MHLQQMVVLFHIRKTLKNVDLNPTEAGQKEFLRVKKEL